MSNALSYCVYNWLQTDIEMVAAAAAPGYDVEGEANMAYSADSASAPPAYDADGPPSYDEAVGASGGSSSEQPVPGVDAQDPSSSTPADEDGRDPTVSVCSEQCHKSEVAQEGIDTVHL